MGRTLRRWARTFWERREPRQNALIPTRRQRLEAMALSFIGNAAFPHLGHLLRWPTRLEPRGLAAWAAFNTLTNFTAYTARRAAADYERMRASLGRDPTPEEWEAHRAAAKQ